MYIFTYPGKGHFASVFGPEYIIVDVFEESSQARQHNGDNSLNYQLLNVHVRFPPQMEDLDSKETHAIERFVQNDIS